ncbi:MAG: hypothetical protein ABIY62_07870 [Ginsengibacter sp.]
MPPKKNIIYLSKFGIVAAILYIIPVIFFLKDRRFADLWLLYLGSALFLMAMFIFGIMYAGKNIGSKRPYNGFIVTIIGVISSCILIVIFTLILAPDVFGIGSANDALRNTPPGFGSSGNHGILFIMLASALIVNFCAGMFAAVMTKSKAEENKLPANE